MDEALNMARNCRSGPVSAKLTATGAKLVPEAFRDTWAAFVSCLVISIVTIFDALFLHPKQMSQRAPVMKLWDGTFGWFQRIPLIGAHLQSKGHARLDVLQAHRMRLPQPYQRSMYQLSQDYGAGSSEDAVYQLMRAKIIRKFSEEDGRPLFETPEGRFFTKGANGALQEIVLNVQAPQSRSQMLTTGALRAALLVMHSTDVLGKPRAPRGLCKWHCPTSR
jgi:hypothetical protein